MDNQTLTIKNGRKIKKQLKEKKRNRIRKTDFVFDKEGNIVFKEFITSDDIPPGEYYPLTSRDNAILYPIKRHSTYKGDTDQKGPFYKDELLEITGDPFAELEDLDVKHDGDDKPTFIPVHKYFPIEEWNPGIREADRNVKKFLQQKDFYRKNQMDYRRSIMLHGDPGTGKSQYLYHLSEQLIRDYDAIIIRIESQANLSAFQGMLQHKLANRPDRLKVVIIEELADFTRSRYANEILGMLDSLHFRENVMFLITTNYPERIPENVVDRPSRLDLLSGVYTKDYTSEFTEKWYEFIMEKPMNSEEKDTIWFRETPGKLSPAYLKELFIYSQLHQVSIDEAWLEIKDRKRKIKDEFQESSDKSIGFDIEDQGFT